MAIPVYCISISEYHVKTKPDGVFIGTKIDKIIKKHFLGQNIVIRCLGSQEHKGKTVKSLVKIIKNLGTDRYNPKRKGEKYENVGSKHIDFFALDFKVTQKGNYMENFIEPFYEYPKQEGKKPVRIDVIIVYDFSKLKRVLHRYEGRTDIKRDGFIFKNPANKPDAIKGIIKVL